MRTIAQLKTGNQMKTEGALQRYMKNQCSEFGILFHKVESRSARGFPDVFLAYDGRIVLVELKNPTGCGRLSKLQERCIGQLRSQGVIVLVVASKAEADAAVDLALLGLPC